MRAAVLSVAANDLPNWPDWQPGGVADERQWFTVTVGPVGDERGDLFQVCIASDARFRQFPAGSFVGLTVATFNAAAVRRATDRFVTAVVGADWPAVASGLAPQMQWEFAGYQ